MSPCEVCARPVAAQALGAGAGGPALYVRDEGRPATATAAAAVTGAVEETCAGPATGPDGLLHLGSREAAQDETSERTP